MDAVNSSNAEHGGRIVKNTGDGFLAEFRVRSRRFGCDAIHRTRIRELTIEDTEDRRLLFRVGINIVSELLSRMTFFGDGVNIAARLEHRRTGGICISSSAYDQVLGKVTVEVRRLWA